MLLMVDDLFAYAAIVCMCVNECGSVIRMQLECRHCYPDVTRSSFITGRLFLEMDGGLDQNGWLNGWLDQNGWLNGWLDLSYWMSSWKNGWLNGWENCWLWCWHHVWFLYMTVVTWLVWVSDSLETKKFLLEALKFTAYSDNITAATTLEWLTCYTLFVSISVLVGQLMLSLWQAFHGGVKHLLHIG
jgi:hypothetical protein